MKLFARKNKNENVVKVDNRPYKTYNVELVKFNLWVRYPTVKARDYSEAKKIAVENYEGFGWVVKSVYEA